MKMLSLEKIIKAVNGELICGNNDTIITGISTDSRKINEGDLFVPIVGEKFDGHEFIKGSLNAGAAAALTSRHMEPAAGKAIIKVEDTLVALGDVARFYRGNFDIPFVGITGSVGKTSTKDMISCVLSQKYNVHKTMGNFNNHIGLPLTIFNLDSFHEAAVIEMGMSGFGEIRYLSSIARPDIAVITNIGLSHIEKLGSRQNILKAKMEILEGLKSDGMVVLNGDDKLLYGLKDLLSFRTVYFGMEDGLQYQACNVKTMGEGGTYFEITLRNTDYKVNVPVPGIHNIYNALAAIAVGTEMNIPMEKIIEGIAEFTPGKMRLSIIENDGIKIINDAYNANPQSMEAALDVLKDIGESSRTVAVLGDMLEMGEWAYDAHMDIGRYAFSKGIDYIFTVGENGRNIANGALESGAQEGNVLAFNSNNDIESFLKDFIKSGDVVLIKGSRGMKMEEIVEKLTER
jgi:UDP-N-acetylmuramoyl-tripeptide--D-alanyl-D-alanine ligase